MQERFLQFIKKHALFDRKHKLLLAISGGVDSMVMWDLVNQAGNEYAVAHCNFQLRGSDSDEDEAFVQSKANTYQVPFFSTSFETKAHANAKGISTQMAARDLRYEWFREVMEKHGFQRLLVAHHKDDSVETFFLNLIRGTSVKGLSGIAPLNNDVARPMLCFSREEVEVYAEKHQIDWREDSSNEESYYKRNFLRHEIIPRIKEQLNPGFLETMSSNMEKMVEMNTLLKKEAARFAQGNVKSRSDGVMSLKKQELIDQQVGPLLLYELIGQKGFSHEQCMAILISLKGIPGKQFFTESHVAVVDREEVLVKQVTRKQNEKYLIGKDDFEIEEPVHYNLSILSSDSFALDRKAENAMLDMAKLEFPLEVRKWQKGDRFRPIGMKGQKLVSDLLIDEKVSVIDKDNVYVLLSGKQIVWVVGIRLSDDFKVTDKTKSILHFELKE